LDVIDDLRIQYGDNDCSPSTGFPTRNIHQQIEDNENLELQKSKFLI
jgi:Flp pilus assembly protein TadB